MTIEQKVVLLRGEKSFLLAGDPLRGPDYDGTALPKLLAEGWQVESMRPLPVKAGPDAEPCVYCVLERRTGPDVEMDIPF